MSETLLSIGASATLTGPRRGQLGNQLVVLQPLGATSYVVGSDTVTVDSWRVTVPLLARW
jgi:hypothetical protein